jgi:type II secretory pathway pseudopilin PulG
MRMSFRQHCVVRSGLPPRARRGISLLEVLVVFSIVLFLAAMMLPSMARVRVSAWRVQCKNNLHHWGVALQMYRDDSLDYLPTEGTYRKLDKPYVWYNVLPPYLDAPSYSEVRRVDGKIEDYPALHIWICPAKNQTYLRKSSSGKNQFHYAMNMVLDGMSSSRMPDFPDEGFLPIHASRFVRKPHTVVLFDVYGNSPNGKQSDVATSFHEDRGHVLYLSGAVDGFRAKDFVVDGDYSRRELIWDHPNLYWGYTPPAISAADE